MKRINFKQTISLHELLIDETGGSRGIRDKRLLDSALSAPFQSFSGEYLYRSILDQAAQIGFSLINNHAFIDGNKRIGLLVMLTFLELNGYDFVCSDDKIVQIVLGVASGKIDCQEFRKWVNTAVIPTQDRE